MTPAAGELRRVREGARNEPAPAGFEIDRVTYPGGDPELALAREALAAQLEGDELPGWFVERCIDDRDIKTCEVRRWSLRAWRYWLDPENRRWWWWDAHAGEGGIEVAVLVREKPYLRGALDWLFTVAREAAAPA